MEGLTNFALGVTGSLAMEVYLACQSYLLYDRLPKRFRRRGFYVARVLLMAVSGVVATASAPHSPLLAFYIGASAPAILHSIAKNANPSASDEGANVSNILDDPPSYPPDPGLPRRPATTERNNTNNKQRKKIAPNRQ